MKYFCAAGSQGVRLIIAQVVKKFSRGRNMRIGSINPIDVGPDDELFGVHHVRNDSTGKIGAVAAKRGDTAVGSCADEASDDGNEAVFEQRKEYSAAALFGFLKMRFGVAKGVASEDKIGGGDGNRSDAGLFKSSSEETGTESFAKGREAVGEFGRAWDITI